MGNGTGQAPTTIAVAGDVAIDWNIARVRPQIGSRTSPHYIWGSDIATRVCRQVGGAALLADLLRESFRGEPRVQVVDPEHGAGNATPADRWLTHSYAIWSEFPKGKDGKKTVWRVSEFCGIDKEDSEAAVPGSVAKSRPEPPPEPRIVVLDDAALGFRERRDSWPRYLDQPSRRASWVVVKMADPVAHGTLWEHLVKHFSGRLVSVIPLGDLRKSSYNVSYGLSWERTSSEIVQAVKTFPRLLKHSTVIVTIETAGAVVVDQAGSSLLVYDPQNQEGDWKRNHPGMGVGYGSCFAAAVARELAASPKRPDWGNAAKRGVNAARVLHQVGYATGEGKLADLAFPTREVVAALKEQPPDSLAAIAISDFGETATILSSYEPGIKDLAIDVVRLGPKPSLVKIPVERIGKWSSVDRHEIESVRIVRNIIEEYVAQSRHERPLSLAVFGPPGSGKSFAIKQLAEALMPGTLKPIEFNLTQFKTPDELAPAFHIVRDSALSDEIPLVFWDEFDTHLERELGWIRYFLVPMQDGKFNENGIPHPLGSAVFVFAGGIYKTMDEFRAAAESKPEMKGRDFLSRLRGFLDISGPNPRTQGEKAFILRRALLLRSLLERKAKHLVTSKDEVQIDDGVLGAFLKVREYRHGARSMEAIIDMSRLSGKLKFERSALPAPHQLDMHVDADEFLGLVSDARDNG